MTDDSIDAQSGEPATYDPGMHFPRIAQYVVDETTHALTTASVRLYPADIIRTEHERIHFANMASDYRTFGRIRVDHDARKAIRSILDQAQHYFTPSPHGGRNLGEALGCSPHDMDMARLQIHVLTPILNTALPDQSTRP